MAVVRPRRAGFPLVVGRGIDDTLVPGKKVRARRLPAAVRDHSETGAVDRYREDLVTLEVIASRLEDQAHPVEGETRLGVLAAEGQLANAPEMRLAFDNEGFFVDAVAVLGRNRLCEKKRDEVNAAGDDSPHLVDTPTPRPVSHSITLTKMSLL